MHGTSGGGGGCGGLVVEIQGAVTQVQILLRPPGYVHGQDGSHRSSTVMVPFGRRHHSHPALHSGPGVVVVDVVVVLQLQAVVVVVDPPIGVVEVVVELVVLVVQAPSLVKSRSQYVVVQSPVCIGQNVGGTH